MCKGAIQNLGFMQTFVSDKHSIQYIKDVDGFLVNGNVLIPMNMVQEVVIEGEEKKPAHEPKKVH